ncbi:dihydrofolate reductase family protein [Parafilimonas sp.]|uniref:dihydrofolate reductase family protein n=1 Tax=Parafilimonas sp. TaxID=1969739 RepID=UPI0039E659ED
MRVVLYANVSANGKILLSENLNHQAPQEIINFSVQDIKQAKNLVMGRKSFEVFEKAFGGAAAIKAAFPDVEFVWLSTTAQTNDERKVAKTPEEAVKYLSGKGIDKIIVGGGTETYNAFLETDLITDVLFNVVPIITNGGDLGNSDKLNIKFKLAGQKLLTDDVIQLRYSRIERRKSQK